MGDNQSLENTQEGNSEDIAKYKLEQATDDLDSARLLLNGGKYKAANNRAYYACFHAVDAILALEQTAFKKHKDTLAYFNKSYVHTEIFPKEIGRKIAKIEVIRHKSDYDTFYIASKEEAMEQIDIAAYVISLIEEYVKKKISSRRVIEGSPLL